MKDYVDVDVSKDIANLEIFRLRTKMIFFDLYFPTELTFVTEYKSIFVILIRVWIWIRVFVH